MSEDSSSQKEERIKLLRKEILRHDELYYRQANPEVSDQEYDRLKRDLESLGSGVDQLDLFTSSNLDASADQRKLQVNVGDDRLDEFDSHTHAEAMLSLDNTYDQNEFFEFDKRLKKIFGEEDLNYVVEPKIDGVAVSLTYRAGELESAVTRGNGIEGDIITQNLLH